MKQNFILYFQAYIVHTQLELNKCECGLYQVRTHS